MKVICNASPLIALAKSGLLDLLHSMFDQVAVPQAVVAEVMAGGPEDEGRQALSRTPWLVRVILDPPVSTLATLPLGKGEAEVIEWALRHADCTALLDDRAARRTAEALGVRCAGTLRVVFDASRKNLVPSFADAVARLRSVGLYCDEHTIDAVCRSPRTGLGKP